MAPPKQDHKKRISKGNPTINNFCYEVTALKASNIQPLGCKTKVFTIAINNDPLKGHCLVLIPLKYSFWKGIFPIILH